MEDARIWSMEEKLWRGGADVYDELVDENVVMALPAEPHVFSRERAKEAVKSTPHWDEVRFSDQRVERPEEGLIVIGYRVEASGGGQSYEAFCTSTIRRLGHEDWKVIQHSQLVPLTME
ncbi:DUF4440 domain-containing protein [Sphingomonas ginkgonis]|uniref:DUF4440 domain-containing protein n=1 Tax=Sphingomonas ginkgonis TaxID=2315330 RepID=A0A429VCT0_9SPHN|nr:DUF4440 domain-containing protein [Sphingomonas ginkgonis]RST31754.1 DUF4440 domain-containing protein [Sphingomonas ginkgonis]